MTGGKHASRRRAALLLAALCLLAAPAAAAAQEAGQKQDVRPPPMINAGAFKDFLAEGKRLLDEGQLGPQTTFDSTVTAELDGSGHLNLETVQSQNTARDAQAMKLAAHLVQAINRSGLLGMLDGAKEVRISLKLDSHAFSAGVSSELESEETASQFARGYGVLAQVARAQKKGKPEGELYSGMSFASEGRRFVMKLELPREAAVRLFRDAADRASAAAGAGRN